MGGEEAGVVGGSGAWGRGGAEAEDGTAVSGASEAVGGAEEAEAWLAAVSWACGGGNV